jgi:hypothetical protein
MPGGATCSFGEAKVESASSNSEVMLFRICLTVSDGKNPLTTTQFLKTGMDQLTKMFPDNKTKIYLKAVHF